MKAKSGLGMPDPGLANLQAPDPRVARCCQGGRPGWCVHTMTMLCAEGLDRQQGAPAGAACSCTTASPTELLQRGLNQLRAWHEWYGRRQPDALPPAGDVRWLEDVEAFLKKGGA